MFFAIYMKLYSNKLAHIIIVSVYIKKNSKKRK